MKLRLLSGATARVVEIAEVRVLESVREGYEPAVRPRAGGEALERQPARGGATGPRMAAAVGRGLVIRREERCFGCHVQAQALMGQAVALEQGYRVSMPAMRALTDFMRKQQTPDGHPGLES